jgi:hypothetical protein
MADASKYLPNIEKYATAPVNQAAAEKIVGHLGIALQSLDSSLVSSQQSEIDRVRNKWLIEKLKLLNQSHDELNAAIAATAEKMAPEKNSKSRVTFYYLLAEHFGKLDELASNNIMAA